MTEFPSYLAHGLDWFMVGGFHKHGPRMVLEKYCKPNNADWQMDCKVLDILLLKEEFGRSSRETLIC